jgi:hypothetical protein
VLGADLLELRTDGRDGGIRHADERHDERAEQHRDERARDLERNLPQPDDDGERADRDREAAGFDLTEAFAEVLQAAEEVRDRGRGVGDAERRAELGTADDQGDTRREADHDRIGDEADGFAEAQGAEGQEHHAGHQGGQGEAEVAVGDDRRGADADEGAGRTGDLHARAAEE